MARRKAAAARRRSRRGPTTPATATAAKRQATTATTATTAATTTTTTETTNTGNDDDTRENNEQGSSKTAQQHNKPHNAANNTARQQPPGPMLASKEPHIQPVECGEVPSSMSQLKLRNGGGRPFGGHARRSTKALATRRCSGMLIMSASSVVLRGKRAMSVNDEGAKGGAASRSGCRMRRSPFKPPLKGASRVRPFKPPSRGSEGGFDFVEGGLKGQTRLPSSHLEASLPGTRIRFACHVPLESKADLKKVPLNG